MKKLGFFLLFLICFNLARSLCDKATDGFSISNLHASKFIPNATYGDTSEALSILGQKFTYLAAGGQTYVFASEDGHYVLKFFRKTPSRYIPFKHYQEKKWGKVARAMKGYLLAYEHLQDESGLVFISFDNTLPDSMQTTLVDPLGITHTLSLSDIPFIIQKRGEPLENYLNKTSQPQEALRAVLNLVGLRLHKGIGDDDPRWNRNIGFLEGRPIFLDPGCFVPTDKREVEIPKKFRGWLRDHALEACL